MTDIEEIKVQHDIVQLIGSSVALKKRGRLYAGLCPFHVDTDPSLKVYPGRQFFKCYGCGAKGDVIDWIQMTVGVDFKGAIKLLGNLPQTEALFKPAPKRLPTKISLETAHYWHDRLGKKRTYFHNRGFANNTIDREIWGHTGRRYALTIWAGQPGEELLAVKLRRDDEIELSRLSKENPDLDDEQIQKSLRLAPKYVLKGSYDKILYNSHAVENKVEVWIFFGEFDAALATQLGLPACSPVHGANGWARSWGRTHLRCARRINIFPDKGEERQGYQVKSMLGGQARVCKFPDGSWKDFTEYILAGNNIERLMLNEKETM